VYAPVFAEAPGGFLLSDAVKSFGILQTVQEENLCGMVLFLAKDSLKVPEYLRWSSVENLQSKVFAPGRLKAKKLPSVQVAK
jgi:hypothetical protein